MQSEAAAKLLGGGGDASALGVEDLPTHNSRIESEAAALDEEEDEEDDGSDVVRALPTTSWFP